jgi:hypothetical protein
MKISDILNENATCSVARYYIEASIDNDAFYNPEDVKYKNRNKEYYKKYFKSWFSEEKVPVFKKPTTKPQSEYTTKPKPGALQSPGYRGREYAKAAAGMPYDHEVQRYAPSAGNMVIQQTMDAARNNNGQ